MKHLIITAVIAIVVCNLYAQKRINSIETRAGWVIHEGDSIRLGKGSNTDGTFRYVSGPEFLKGITYTDKEGKQTHPETGIDKRYNYSGYVVYRIFNDGTLHTRKGARLVINIEPAIKAGELLQKREKETTIMINQGSAADELAKLKKLYDDGVLTKDEYEAQKKKILNQ